MLRTKLVGKTNDTLTAMGSQCHVRHAANMVLDEYDKRAVLVCDCNRCIGSRFPPPPGLPIVDYSVVLSGNSEFPATTILVKVRGNPCPAKPRLTVARLISGPTQAPLTRRVNTRFCSPHGRTMGHPSEDQLYTRTVMRGYSRACEVQQGHRESRRHSRALLLSAALGVYK